MSQTTSAVGARMLLANCEDTTNRNITITAREIAPDLPIVAIVEEEDSIDVLKLSGATTVLPLKHQLGEFLANRADTGVSVALAMRAYRGLQIAELPARDTMLAGPEGSRYRQPDLARTQRRGHSLRWSRLRTQLRNARRRGGDVVAARVRASGARGGSGTLFDRRAPSLAGRRLADSGIGSATGLSVIALDRHGSLVTRLTGETPLDSDAVLIMLGSLEQRRKFGELFENRFRSACRAVGLLSSDPHRTLLSCV